MDDTTEWSEWAAADGYLLVRIQSLGEHAAIVQPEDDPTVQMIYALNDLVLLPYGDLAYALTDLEVAIRRRSV